MSSGDIDTRVFRSSRALGASIVLVVLAFSPSPERGSLLHAQEYERPVDAAPQPEDIGESYVLPPVQRPKALAEWRHLADVVLLGLSLGVVSWIVLRRRSRSLAVWATTFCLIYFGFYREGCVCPIGATQNVSTALVDPSYTIPILIVVIFFLPLLTAIFFGRIFCGGVCPLGAIQELVVLRPVQVPRRLDRALGLFKYVYLGLAIWYAMQPAVDRDFIICRFDPFVGLFRRTGPGDMLMLGGGFLLLGLFIGRPYCRYLCPYGALLALISRLSWRGVSITPDREMDCGLCARACPYGAIEKMRAVRSSCLACARCYDSCPREHVRRGEVDPATAENPPKEEESGSLAKT